MAAGWVASSMAFDPWRAMPSGEPRALPGDAQAYTVPCDAASPPQPLTLEDAIQFALCRNPQARQSWAVAMGQAAQVGAARGAYLPAINASLSRTHDVVDTEFSNGQETTSDLRIKGRNLTLSYLLLDFGGRSATVRQARENLSAALSSHDALVQSLFTAVAQAYFDAAAAGASVQATQQSEETARESLAAAQAKLDLGAGTVVDKLQARTALSQATLARVKAQSQAKTQEGQLAYVMGLDVRTALTLAAPATLEDAGQLPLPSTAFLKDLDALMNRAVEEHPSVAAARAQVGAAEARRSVLVSEGLPTLSLNYGQYHNGRPGTPFSPNHTTERLAALTLSIPIFEGFSRYYKVREAEAGILARQAELAQAQSQVGLEVWRNYQTLQAETANLGTSADLLVSASESLQASQERYKAGSGDIIELLNAQRDDAVARQERIHALAAWRSARLKLLGALGQVGFWALDVPERAGGAMPPPDAAAVAEKSPPAPAAPAEPARISPP